MNTRRVNYILSSKHKEFVASIKDEEISQLVDKNSIITGGVIPSLLLNEKINDFDYYFTDKHTALKVARYFVDIFNQNRINEEKKINGVIIPPPEVYVTNSNGATVLETNDFTRIKVKVRSAGAISSSTEKYNYAEYTNDENQESVIESITHEVEEADKLDSELMEPTKDSELYKPVFITDNAITLSGRIQLVIRFFGDVKDIHKNFDYVHCTNYWLSKNKTLYLSKKALTCIIAKELKYTGSQYPICSLFRMRKFLQRGWQINAGQILKMALQISKLDLEDYKVLEDQLVGVDTAYFSELLSMLKQKDDNETNELPKISQPYLVTLIDRIF